MSITLPHIASRVFDRPLAIAQQKADVIVRAILPRIRGEFRFDPPRVKAAVGESYQPVLTQGGTIALISVLGTLVHRAGALDAESGLVSYQWIQHEFTRALDDWHVEGILLDIDSAGGEISGLLDLGDLIREGRSEKPIFAVADDFALSAGYLLASAAERLFLTQTASVGSVGVLALHVDQSGQDEQQGLKYSTIFAGERKNDFDPHHALSPQARNELQKAVDGSCKLLCDQVGRNRGRSGESIRRLEAGILQRQEAVRRGLADEVGNLNEALTALSERIRRGTAKASSSRAAAAFPEVEGRKYESVRELYARRRAEAQDAGTRPSRGALGAL